ncbi:MAG TPA: hypothetical protein VN962_14550 [Polyangia bacterium]|nr:hypothetical protein [Polyangia bacterium]
MGTLSVVFPYMEDTYAEAMAASADKPLYQMWMDGHVMTLEDGSLVGVGEGGIETVRYFAAGPHHFTIAAPGQPAIFDGDGDIMADGYTTLVLFGTLDALQGRFFDTPNLRAPDMEHVIVFNLARTGPSIEVVKCTAPNTCTTVTGPFAYGDGFAADLPTLGALEHPTSSSQPDGVGYGYRAVPSATEPNPPVRALYPTGETRSFLGAPSDGGDF